MGDMGEIFEAMKEHNRERRRHRQAQAPSALERLSASGLDVEQFSDEHYRVWKRNGLKYFDYWPSSGYWKDKSGKQTGYNIEPLLRACQ